PALGDRAVRILKFEPHAALLRSLISGKTRIDIEAVLHGYATFHPDVELLVGSGHVLLALIGIEAVSIAAAVRREREHAAVSSILVRANFHGERSPTILDPSCRMLAGRDLISRCAAQLEHDGLIAQLAQ